MSRRLDQALYSLMLTKLVDAKDNSHDADDDRIAPSYNFYFTVGHSCCAGCTGEVFSPGGISCVLRKHPHAPSQPPEI